MNRRGKKVSDKKINDMYMLYSQGESIASIAKTYKVSPVTVRKYRDLQNWTIRRQAIREKAAKNTDNDMVRRRERWIRTGRALQQIGTSKFYDENGKLKANVIKDMTAGDGIRAIAEGVKIEKETIGEDTDNLVITVKLPKSLEGME